MQPAKKPKIDEQKRGNLAAVGSIMKKHVFALTMTTALIGATALAQEVNFSVIDTNGDGVLQQGEIFAVFGEKGSAAIAVLESDDYGNVSWQEATDGRPDRDDKDDVQSARGAAASALGGENRSERGRTASELRGNNRSAIGAAASQSRGDNRSARDRDASATARDRGSDRGGNGRGSN